jgi:photosystem II stability/assembly factor-like uncharacterized protein
VANSEDIAAPRWHLQPDTAFQGDSIFSILVFPATRRKRRRQFFCDNCPMPRPLTLLLFSAASVLAQAQAAPEIQRANSTEDLRGVSVVSRKIAWASGTHGTYLRTNDGGGHWLAAQIPDAAALDFRAVVAFSAAEAFLMSAGPGHQSRIYHTADAGQHWSLQFTNQDARGFFDSMVFWDATHGIVLGDPIPDRTGQLKFELLTTDDGHSWKRLVPPTLPAALEGEGAFAASNSCVALQGDNIWFASGGGAARVFHSADRGQSWQVTETPIIHGPDSAGIFSITFGDRTHGVIAGGDYKQPKQDGPNLAFSEDGGKTWKLSSLRPQAYFSAVTFDRTHKQRIFIVASDSILDLRLPLNPRKINSPKDPRFKLNAVSPYPEGGALFVGPKGTIVALPTVPRPR